MTFLTPTVALVVIAGPQASGKSTVASALTAELRSQGEQVALVELDQIASMAAPQTPADWDAAHRIFEAVVARWTRAGMTCVIAEGSGSSGEVERLLSQAPVDGVAIIIAVTAPFEVALARAQADPTRGISKDREFLSAVYNEWPHQLRQMAPDLTLDTHTRSISETVRHISATIREARSAPITARN